MEASKWSIQCKIQILSRKNCATSRPDFKEYLIPICTLPEARRLRVSSCCCVKQPTSSPMLGGRMVLEKHDPQLSNARLAEDLKRSAIEAIKIIDRLEARNRRLYDRNDQLEGLLRQNKLPVPDWPRAETGGV